MIRPVLCERLGERICMMLGRFSPRLDLRLCRPGPADDIDDEEDRAEAACSLSLSSCLARWMRSISASSSITVSQ